MFPTAIVQGSKQGLLTRPNMVLISESFARRYFGDENPLEKILIQYPAQQFEIEAVFKDFPRITHFSPDLLISFHENMFLPPSLAEAWREISFYTYLLLGKQADRKQLENAITALCLDKNELKKLVGIQSLAISNNTPGDIPAFAFSATEQKDRQGIKIAQFIADSSYLEVFGIDIVEGEGLRRSNPDGCIINRTTLFQLGYSLPEEVFGKTLYLNDESGMQTIECRISGFCEDFDITSVKELPDPIILMEWTSSILFGRYTLSLHPEADGQRILRHVEPLFIRTFPNFSFEYYWVEDHYNSQFAEDLSILKTLKGFGFIAILLGVLSLLSMVRQFSHARIKDIGIRKVHGATAILIGSLTVTVQSLQVAGRNPAESIRYE